MVEAQSAVVEAYRQAEQYLLHLIAEAVDGSATQAHWVAQQEQLARVMRLARKKLAQLEGHLSQAVLEELEEEYARAVAEAYRQSTRPVPTLIPTGAVEATAAETTAAIASQHGRILRTVNDTLREIQAASITAALVSGEAHQQSVQAMLNRLADRGITSFVDKAGRRWAIDTYTDMALRAGRMRAMHEGHQDGWQQTGVELVRVSTHPASHPWCYPFQGELLALSGPAGARQVTNRLTGEVETVQVKATFQEALDAGYHHVNCRHSEAPYVPGVDIPVPEKPSEEENEAQYRALQEQRRNERAIRHWKKREAVARTDEDKAFTRRKVREWQARQRQHLKANKHLVRRYEREKVRA